MMAPQASTDATLDVTASTDVSRFLKLPTELRLYVYEYLVVVDKIFYTPDQYSVSGEKRYKDWTTDRTPSLQILCVSKQIHAGAEEVYP